MVNLSAHQQNQIEVINKIEEQIKNNALNFSTVSPVSDFENDSRICLTSVHIPAEELKQKIQTKIIDPLKEISPNHYYYSIDSIHMTIKNIRIINDPPNFNKEDVGKIKEVFDSVIPKHKKFNVYFYRLFFFPMNLALFGTTDSELDNIVLDLDKNLKEVGVPDDKIYVNNKYFFSNITLARFTNSISEEFTRKIDELSKSFSFEPYTVDSIALLSCNAAFKKRTIFETWNLNS